MSSFNLSGHQKEYWSSAIRRWNIKSGATRSGKTWLDYYVIPRRIRAIAGKPGIVLLLGNTESTLERNVLEPMRAIYGDTLVGYVNNSNKVKLFGRTCYALGADKISQVKKIQGASVAYCYGDEVVTWNKEVFEMLKSRLDKPYSMFDGTCNPDNRSHWFKKFLDSDADIYLQQYQLDDNPFLPDSFKIALKKEYAGTVYYNRYILGQWCNAEGLLFQQLANNPKDWILDELPDNIVITNIGLDIGGTKSHSTLTATGLTKDFQEVITYKEDKIIHAKGTVDTNIICQRVVLFVRELIAQGRNIKYVFVDNAEQVILNTISNALIKAKVPVRAIDCTKVKGSTRILCYNLLLNTYRMKFYNVPIVVESLTTQLYDSKKSEDSILDDFTTDVDTFDSHFYSFSAYIDYLIKGGGN